MLRDDFRFCAAVLPVAMLCVLILSLQVEAQEFGFVSQQPAMTYTSSVSSYAPAVAAPQSITRLPIVNLANQDWHSPKPCKQLRWDCVGTLEQDSAEQNTKALVGPISHLGTRLSIVVIGELVQRHKLVYPKDMTVAGTRAYFTTN